MVRMNIDEAARNLPQLIEKLERDGQTIELSRGDRVVARISPAEGEGQLQGKDLMAFFASLPDLGDDREAFARDIESARDIYPKSSGPRLLTARLPQCLSVHWHHETFSPQRTPIDHLHRD